MTAQTEMAKLLEAYKAMADETRLRLLALVSEQPRNGRQLSQELGISQPAVSHHVEKLRRAGLLLELREGRERVYGLNRATLASIARQHLSQSRIEVEDDAQRVLRDFFDGDRLRSIPAQRKKRVVVLRRLLEWFESGREYSEREVNEVLGRAHEDIATLRRELVMYGFMTRERGVYRVAERLPEYGRNVAQEMGSS